MMDEQNTVDIVQYLQQLPDEHIISWYADDLSQDKPFGHGWIDIELSTSEAQQALQMNWVWTIEEYSELPTPDGTPPEWCFQWPPDLDVHTVYIPHPIAPTFLLQEAVTQGIPLTDQRNERLSQTLSETPTAQYDIIPAWSPLSINRALQAWATQYAQRPDLQFEWDYTHGPSAQLQEILDEVNTAKCYQLNEHISCTDRVMDQFLSDPEKAADIMNTLNQFFDGISND